MTPTVSRMARRRGRLCVRRVGRVLSSACLAGPLLPWEWTESAGVRAGRREYESRSTVCPWEGKKAWRVNKEIDGKYVMIRDVSHRRITSSILRASPN